MADARSRDIPGMLRDALAHQLAGRLNEAERIFQQILAIDARNADSLHLLGTIAHQRGRHEVAAGLIRAAIAINRDYAPYHCHLGTVLQAQDKLDEAEACYKQALALAPDFAEVHSNFGNILLTQGKVDEAAACQERAVALKPDSAEIHCNLGTVRQAQGRLNEAVACYERALALKPGYPTAHNNLGNTLTALDRLEDARAHYQRALVLRPDYAAALNNLGSIFLAQGKFDEAMANFEMAISVRPDYAKVHFNRAEIKSFRPGDPDLAALEALAKREDFSADDAAHIHFALAKALEDIGDYTRAFENLHKGNALKRRQINYDEAALLKYFQRIASVFDGGLLDRFKGQGDPSPVPVFVLGMPRSGSTLIEQILASHPQIYGAGELRTLEKLEAGEVLCAGELPYPECVPKLDGDALRRLGNSYLADLTALQDGKIRVVDKLPGNFLRIGLIRLILPNARIIHTMRDPIDTCVSCYSKLFDSGLYYSYDLGELGRVYRCYAELMAHWRRVLPLGVVLDVAYEDVVNDLEGQARRLIEHCGLPWDDRCLSFQQNSRPVKTASAVQVRQPLFRSSLQRWRRHEAGLAPLLRELGEVELGSARACGPTPP
jgi:tetratricopeptide (TPR) repeat protein